MAILDAEFQFDRHKLTYFFEADRRIDFRELVSELFSLYKTRIWMQQVESSSIPDPQDYETQLAQASGLLPTSHIATIPCPSSTICPLPPSTSASTRAPMVANSSMVSMESSSYLSNLALENMAHVDNLYRNAASNSSSGLRSGIGQTLDASWRYNQFAK